MADVTEVTHRRVLAVALPIVLSNASVPILGTVDTGVVGQMGEAAPIGAVGIGAIILTGIYWIFGFLRMGTTGFASQAIGRGDGAETSAILMRGLGLAAVAGAGLILLQVPLFWLAFQVSPASARVEELARDYMAIRIFSAPAIIAVYALTGWLIAAERTRAVFAIQIVMNGLNILLDLLFVLQLGWGVEGVAIATFIAEWSGAALGLWFCRDAFRHPAWRDRARLLDPAKLRRFAQVNTDIMIRSMLLQAIFISFLLLGGRFGDVTLAANQVLLQFLYITAYGMDGFAFAVEAIVGSALGQGRRDLFRRGALLCAFWSGVIGVTMAVAFSLFGGHLIDLMSTDPEVREAARRFLPYMVAAPILGWAAWILDGIFIGAIRTKDMRNMMLLSFAVYALALLALLPVGNHGLWLAFLISFVVRGLTLGSRYPALEASVG
ncbi:MATE family efflux transporter [Palleronia caenipelagi]|uniref:MATE family efflux transporter n=1 Tax=Palleronia caenipelagi TaxID=2489174 RepID=A0A547Q7F5_9RHOB|nr:MATE family efflux transporter [Palleronia caenipelagi]TRD22293.1 MATE family efflux transporter [Palleronia caenipelagi]